MRYRIPLLAIPNARTTPIVLREKFVIAVSPLAVRDAVSTAIAPPVKFVTRLPKTARFLLVSAMVSVREGRAAMVKDSVRRPSAVMARSIQAKPVMTATQVTETAVPRIVRWKSFAGMESWIRARPVTTVTRSLETDAMTLVKRSPFAVMEI